MARARSPEVGRPTTRKAAPKPKAARPPKVPAAPPAARSGLAGDEGQQLIDGAVRSRENNASAHLDDRLNRHWFVGVMNLENHSHVLIQVRRGDAVRERYLSTATFTPDLVGQAIADLDGELQ